jgi:PAS domain S-box-containing protein
MEESKYTSLVQRLHKNLLLFAGVSITIIITVLAFTIYTNQQEKNSLYEQEIASDIKRQVATSLDTLTNKYELTLKRILSNNAVKKLFIEQDRIKLYLLLENEWNFLVQDNPYVKVMHFHNADGTSFLRMHNSTKHSDHIAKLRPMIRNIHQYQKSLHGYETGVYATVYRIINPIFYKDKYIGALEIGVDPRYLIKDIENILDIRGLTFFDSQNLQIYIQEDEFALSDMATIDILSQNDLTILNTLPKNYNFTKSTKINVNTKKYYIFPFPVESFDKKVYSKILFFKDISEFKTSQKQYFIKIFIIVFSFLIISLFIAVNFFNLFEKKINAFFSQIIEETKDKNRYLKAIEDNSSNFIVITKNNKMLSLNKTALHFLNYKNIEEFKARYECICDLFENKDGYLQKEMEGKSWCEYVDLYPHLTHKAILKKDDKEYIFLVKSEQINYNNELRYITSLTDITKIESLQTQYQYMIERNKFAEEGASMGLFDWDLRTDAVFYSKVWKKLLGYEEEEVSEEIHEWSDRIHPEDKENVIKDLDKHFAKQTTFFSNYHRLKHKNGNYIYATCRAKAMFNENNQPIRMVGVYVDITEQQKSREKIKEQEELMIAQSRHAAMGEMISMIAHQWRQPIANIAMGANNLLLDVELDSLESQEVKEECESILGQTKYLSNTIDDFRNFFKEDKIKVPVSIENVVEDAIKLMEKSFENNNITIEKVFFSTNNIETFPREILQILLNILKNAKEVLVENNIKNKTIKIYLSEDDTYLYIDIEDNAGGVKKENLTKIFQPYFTTKDEHNGTGLGLYMSKTLAQKHLSGDLKVKNSKLGAVFTLSIKK